MENSLGFWLVGLCYSILFAFWVDDLRALLPFRILLLYCYLANDVHDVILNISLNLYPSS